MEHRTEMIMYQTEDGQTKIDVIISVGYRVKSLRGTQFRIWATKRLNEYIIKGFTMNDELLKKAGGGNYLASLWEKGLIAFGTHFTVTVGSTVAKALATKQG